MTVFSRQFSDPIERPSVRGLRSANVSAGERIASTVAGGLLVGWGIRKHSPISLAGLLAGADLAYRGVSGRCMIYRTLGVDTAAVNRTGAQTDFRAPEVRRSITVSAPPQQLYELWKEPATMARIVGHFAELTFKGDGLIHWRARGPLNQPIEWDSRYAEQQSGKKLSWQTLPGSHIVSHGEVSFEPGPDGTGTEVHLSMQFEPPLGRVGQARESPA